MDKPSILSLYDTLSLLENKNENWLNDRLCRMIFAWQSSIFDEDHVIEVCKEKCPEWLEVCLEYRRYKTIMGNFLYPDFSLQAIHYIVNETKEPFNQEKYGSAPVRDCYIKIVNT